MLLSYYAGKAVKFEQGMDGWRVRYETLARKITNKEVGIHNKKRKSYYEEKRLKTKLE